MREPNSHLLARLSGIQQILMGAHRAGTPLASASKGVEREVVLNSFLADILPPQFRFGLGEATDQMGNKSGQLDIVLEFPFVPSLPIAAGRSPRLYLAEGVAAVVEVKSDLASQWDEVIRTATQLAKLERAYGSGISIGPRAGPKIPLYAVGYEGWTALSTAREKLAAHRDVSGILVISHQNFCGRHDYLDAQGNDQTYAYEREKSPMALWGLLSCLHHAASMVTSTTKDVPRRYDEGEDA